MKRTKNTIKTNLPKAFFLMGPTASGKTSLAVELCKTLPLRIISVDSALIYRGMDIGTNKPNKEVLRTTPHYLLDILDPSQIYSVANFRKDALEKMNKIISSGYVPLLVGGSMLYYKTLLEGLSPLPPSNKEIRLYLEEKAEKYGKSILKKKLEKIDPVSAKRIHTNDLQRIIRALEIFLISGKTLTDLRKISGKFLPYQTYQFVVSPNNREILHKKIRYRFYQMLKSGFEEEVWNLFFRGDLDKKKPSIRCIGYRQMWNWFEGKISYDEMIYKSICATKQLAKRQINWLKKWKWNITSWLDSENPKKTINELLKKIGSNLE